MIKGYVLIKLQTKRFVRKDGLADSIDDTSTIRNMSKTFWSESIYRNGDTNSQKVHASSILNPILHSLLSVYRIELITLYWKALTYEIL